MGVHDVKGPVRVVRRPVDVPQEVVRTRVQYRHVPVVRRVQRFVEGPTRVNVVDPSGGFGGHPQQFGGSFVGHPQQQGSFVGGQQFGGYGQQFGGYGQQFGGYGAGSFVGAPQNF